MRLDIQDQLQWRADLLMRGRYDELADQYLFPLSVHVDGRTVKLQDRTEIMEVFDMWRADWKARGVTRVTIELTDVSEGQFGRLRTWSTMYEYNASGALLGERSMVYYFRRTAKGLRTEMIDATRASAAQTRPQDGEATAPRR